MKFLFSLLLAVATTAAFSTPIAAAGTHSKTTGPLPTVPSIQQAWNEAQSMFEQGYSENAVNFMLQCYGLNWYVLNGTYTNMPYTWGWPVTSLTPHD